MSEIKHTSGPWQWDDDEVWQEGYDTEQHAPWLVGPSGERILTGRIHCLSESDSRLIAAAPELLEALQWMNNLWQCTCALNGWEPEHAREYERAKEVLAKATGSQP